MKELPLERRKFVFIIYLTLSLKCVYAQLLTKRIGVWCFGFVRAVNFVSRVSSIFLVAIGGSRLLSL